jgi:hypothetical protein
LKMEGDAKRCVRCGDCKPRADFARNRSNLDGLQHHCRDCASDYHRARQQALGRKVRPKVEVPEGHKLCIKCGEVNPGASGTAMRPRRMGYPLVARLAGPLRDVPDISSVITASPKPSGTRWWLLRWASA